MGCAATGWPLMVVMSTPWWLVGAQALLATRAKEMRKARGDLRTLRLVGGQKHQQVGIVAAQPRDQLAIAQNDFSISGAGENARRALGIFVHDGKIGPAQDGAVGIGGIGRSHLHELRFFGPGGSVRNWRSISMAAGSANCVAPRPATK